MILLLLALHVNNSFCDQEYYQDCVNRGEDSAKCDQNVRLTVICFLTKNS